MKIIHITIINNSPFFFSLEIHINSVYLQISLSFYALIYYLKNYIFWFVIILLIVYDKGTNEYYI